MEASKGQAPRRSALAELGAHARVRRAHVLLLLVAERFEPGRGVDAAERPRHDRHGDDGEREIWGGSQGTAGFFSRAMSLRKCIPSK